MPRSSPARIAAPTPVHRSPRRSAAPLQYGAGIKAYALNLLIAQMISLQRVQHSIQTLLGQAISEATILKYVLQLHLALEHWEKTAIDRLLTLPAMHVDETSMRVDKTKPMDPRLLGQAISP